MVKQELLASGLMRRAATMQLLGVDDLAGIVEDDASPDEISGMGDTEALKLLEDQVGSLSDKLHMPHQAGRGAQLHQEIAGVLYHMHWPSQLSPASALDWLGTA